LLVPSSLGPRARCGWDKALLECFGVFFVVLGFDLRDYTLSHSTSPFFVMVFIEIRFPELFARLASNLDPPDLCLLSR
jgi:hypothetical protein